MKKKKAKKRLLELIEKLQKNFPVSDNVYLCMKRMRKYNGRAIYDGNGKYIIYVNPCLGIEHQLDIIQHEWAHIRVMDEMVHDLHGSTWGKELAKIYTSFCHNFRKVVK